MSILRYILKSLLFYRKQHLSVFAGTIISTAVLTGALIIGDSVKYSLKHLVDIRLGETEYALHAGDRFVRAELAREIGENLGAKVAPVLNLSGVAVNTDSDKRISTIQVLGVDSSFWQLGDGTQFRLKENEGIISRNVAQRLHLEKGDQFLLQVENANVIPLNAPFVSEEQSSIALRITVMDVAGEEQMGRFSLKSNQTPPYNIFVSRDYLAEQLELDGLINILLVAEEKHQLTKQELNQSLASIWKLKDAGLSIREVGDQWELLSDRIFIDQPVYEVVQRSGLKHESILTYLVNTIGSGGKQTPYSFVTAASQPLVPQNLKKDEIIVNDWLAQDLSVSSGDSLTLDYYVIGALRSLEERSRRFVVKNVVPVTRSKAIRSLMPSFPGLSDAGSCSDWKAGVPVDLKKIRDKDETYWKKYKGTPKAFVSRQTGLELWHNRYGNSTSIRFNKAEVKRETLEKRLLTKLDPAQLNLTFQSVRIQGVSAANNMVDFGGLFLSLSFFIIAAGILLTILIYALNTEARQQEIGVLSGLGFTRKQIIRMRFMESLVTVIFGGIAGAVIGILYNHVILAGLNTVWQDVVRTDMLEISIQPFTLLTGAVSGILIALASIYFVTRRKLSQSVVSLVIDNADSKSIESGKNRLIARLIAFICSGAAITLIIYSLVSSVERNAALLLSAGGLFLIGTVASIYLWFLYQAKDISHEVPGIIKLALRNAGMNRARSIATILLLALGTFSIIITGANRKTFYGVEDARTSGTGGFQFWAETSMPLLHNLNTEEGKRKLGLDGEEVLNGVDFLQFHRLDGDDASCLNLNQVQQPQILGVSPEAFDQRQAFSFANLMDEVDVDHPWLALYEALGENVVPAYADQTVITWGLKKSVGDTLHYTDEQGKEMNLLLVGGLSNSIFQGNILIANEAFRKHYPSVSGSRIMLIDGAQGKKEQVRELAETYLQDYGIEISSTSDRLATFYSVENTYLTVFMLLGGLGVIIGTFGLGIVLMRNLLERKQELALLLAVGYDNNTVFRLIFAENLFLFLAGVACGIGAATIGILPSLLSPVFSMPGSFMLLLIVGILASGTIWIWLPARKALKKNLIVALKNE
ncbi:MAG: ABC transporter permease [Marinifilaceae bacterium]